MIQFAKLFEVDGNQVLFWREPDTERDSPEDYELIHQAVSIDGAFIDVRLSMKLGSADKIFDRIDEAQARSVLTAVQKLIGVQEH